jgi:proline reductase-associated electron transfer protein PrdC
MGGAGFPAGVKLAADLQGGYILVNAAECEPGLRHNMDQLEDPDRCAKTVRGAEYCAEISNASKVIFAIKKKNQAAVQSLKKAIAGKPNVSIFLMPDIYPMGEERAVVRECLGVVLEPDKLPSAAKANVCNVESVLRVAEAIEDCKPCFSKNVTVVGKLNGGKEAHVFRDIPVGTCIGDLIEKAGGIDGEYGEIIMGGPFTGLPAKLDAPTTKTTGGIIVTIPFPDLHGAPVGLLVCACGGGEARMRDLVEKMNGKVSVVTFCKQAVELKPGAPRKCENPGNCPGQAERCLTVKKSGAEYILIGNCSDCSNTVMGSAPKMGLKVMHQTDHVCRTIGHKLYRHLTVSKTVDQDI